MAQPDYVPTITRDRPRASERLPTPRGWYAERPGEVVTQGGPPVGTGFGAPGPDQGYALLLARRFAERLVLAPGERSDDVEAGCMGVALKRASLFGRAPISADVELAYEVWGYLGEAPSELVAARRPLFEACKHSYTAQRRIAERVPSQTLRMMPAEIRQRRAGDGWRSLVAL